jgi:hypothetical protein
MMKDNACGRYSIAPVVRMSLLQICKHVMHDAAKWALFGNASFNVEPHLLQHFSVFESDV